MIAVAVAATRAPRVGSVPAVDRRIVVGYDGSEGSRDALALARSLAGRDGVTLTLVAVLDDGAAETEGPLATEARELLGDAAFSLRTSGGVSAPRALVDAALAEGAEVVVIGSTHRGRLGRVLPGSVGERLLQGAPCAVLIAPRGFADHEHFGLGEIGVGFDGGEEARQALAAAASLAKDLDARLRLIGIDRPIEPHDLIPGELPPTHEDLERALQHALGEIGGVDATTEIVSGAPAAVLAERGVELDLLVIGSRGYGPLRRTLLGGVSAEVIRTAPCPVMVVPRSAEETVAPRR
jgi:nucleotide-binding universal stress UspA family protein